MPRTPPTIQDPLAFGLMLPAIGIGGGSNVSAFGGANRCIFVRMLNGGLISFVRLEVGVASGNISVAAYQNAGTGITAAPSGAPLASSGALACPAAGLADVPLGATVSLAPGDWLALTCDNTTATFRSYGLTTANLFAGLYARQDTAHPAPTAGTLAATSFVPVLFGR